MARKYEIITELFTAGVSIGFREIRRNGRLSRSACQELQADL